MLRLLDQYFSTTVLSGCADLLQSLVKHVDFLNTDTSYGSVETRSYKRVADSPML